MPPLALKEILQLSVAERVQLVEDIWDSIAASPDRRRGARTGSWFDTVLG